MNVVGFNISPRPAARDLSVIVDSHVTLTNHINNISKSAFFALRNIAKIRKFLDRENCERLNHALITSKLDSCNRFLVGLPAKDISKLQRVENTAARIIVGAKKDDHITPILKQLHLLPVSCRIEFKILVITFKALNDQAPNYIKELITMSRPVRTLRSASNHCPTVPSYNTKSYGERTFVVAAAKLWNNLPKNIKLSDSINNFKSLLKDTSFSQPLWLIEIFRFQIVFV